MTVIEKMAIKSQIGLRKFVLVVALIAMTGRAATGCMNATGGNEANTGGRCASWAILAKVSPEMFPALP